MTSPVKAPVVRRGDATAEDRPKTRLCLKCRQPFASEGFGERICPRCKGSKLWRDAVPAQSTFHR